MTGRSRTERILDAYLAPEADRLADRVIEAALADIARTPQRRALGVPWRFPQMTNTMRAAAAIAIVAIVGVGVLAFNLRAPGVGATATPLPTPTAASEPTPAPTASPGPWPSAPGITGWTSYTSEVYGITFGFPEHWHLEASATRKWQASDGLAGSGDPYSDVFASPDGDDQIGLWVHQVLAETGADVGSHAGLAAWAEPVVCEVEAASCATFSDVAEPMCHGRVACMPAVLVPLLDGVIAYFADTEARVVTVVAIGRPDSFPGAAQYGGSVQLLKSILTTMDVYQPEPGQIPSGS